MCLGTDLFVHMKNFSVRTHDEGPAERHRTLLRDDAIGTSRLLFRITKDRIIKLERFCISLIGFSCVAAGSKKGNVEFIESRSVVASRDAKLSVT